MGFLRDARENMMEGMGWGIIAVVALTVLGLAAWGLSKAGFILPFLG